MKPWTTAFVLAALFSHVSALPSRTQDSRRAPPEKAEEPFLIHVDARPKGEERVVRSILEARDELERRLRKNEKWFRVTEDREEAEIVVELLAYWSRMEHDTRTQTYVAGARVHTMQIDVITEHHTLQAEMEIFGARREIHGTQVKRGRGSARGAARELAQELEEHCREHYWELVERRRLRASRGR